MVINIDIKTNSFSTIPFFQKALRQWQLSTPPKIALPLGT